MATSRLLASALAWGALAWGACGGSSVAPGACAAQGSCRKEYSCSDHGGASATALAGLRDSCEAGGHSWADAACDRTASIGHCELQGSDACETQWIFASPLPESERRLSCASAGGVWRTSSEP